MALWLLTGWGLSMANPNTYLSMLGLRLTPSLLYYFAPAWWFVGLLLQLYFIYPLLWEVLQRWGPLKLLIVGCVLAFAARALGALIFTNYLDPCLRGAIFIIRLPEFVLGISLAAWMHRDPERTNARLLAPSTLLLALAALILAFALALTLLGMAIIPFLLGLGLLVLLYAVLGRIEYREGYGVSLGA
jgi:peptidoglycan/LPS O-acetylase OafA/YrhL